MACIMCSEVLSDMIYDNADRNAFHSLLPEQWISSVVSK